MAVQRANVISITLCHWNTNIQTYTRFIKITYKSYQDKLLLMKLSFVLRMRLTFMRYAQCVTTVTAIPARTAKGYNSLSSCRIILRVKGLVMRSFTSVFWHVVWYQKIWYIWSIQPRAVHPLPNGKDVYPHRFSSMFLLFMKSVTWFLHDCCCLPLPFLPCGVHWWVVAALPSGASPGGG